MGDSKNRLLIIGNGFDIAHKLPTKYIDFLRFSKMFTSMYTIYQEKNSTLAEEEADRLIYKDSNAFIGRMLKDVFVVEEYKDGKNSIKLTDAYIKTLFEQLDKNLWLDYFWDLLCQNQLKGINWIDFEAEISEIICWIDLLPISLEKDRNVVMTIMNNNHSNHYKRQLIISLIRNHCNFRNFEQLIEELFFELQKITNALNSYLYHFVEKIPCNKDKFIESINPRYILSFNYTHTFQKMYNNYADVCYIHGECSDKTESNIVLGIDEYLDENDKNIKTNMSVFKKFVQRIRNHTDKSYLSWSDDWAKELEHNKFNDTVPRINPTYYEDVEVFVYGHSLGITDKDVLSIFLNPENMALKIYAYTKMEEGKLISSLIKIIGEDTLIEKANSFPNRLMFIEPQKN